MSDRNFLMNIPNKQTQAHTDVMRKSLPVRTRHMTKINSGQKTGWQEDTGACHHCSLSLFVCVCVCLCWGDVVVIASCLTTEEASGKHEPIVFWFTEFTTACVFITMKLCEVGKHSCVVECSFVCLCVH